MAFAWVRALLCAATVSMVPAVALGQSATALDRFDPAPAGDGSFAVPRADVAGDLRASGAFVLGYGHAPLVLRIGDAGSGQTASHARIVSHQLTAHLLVSVDVDRRVKFDLDIPFTASQGGESPNIDPSISVVPGDVPRSFPSPTGAAMNDVRLGARLVLARQRGKLPAASVGYAVWFPSGNAAEYTGTGSIRHAPSILLGAEYGRHVWSVQLARRAQDSGDGAGLLTSEVLFGASFASRVNDFSAHVELFGSTNATDSVSAAVSSTHLELLVGGRYRFGPLSAGLMGGPGLTRGIGTPTFRVLGTVGASFDTQVERRLPTVTKKVLPTPKKPVDPASVVRAKPLDTDGDTVPDAQDVCPLTMGDPNAAERRGCPSDRDGDRIVDVDDRCPDEPGVATADPARFGCPADTDGDGIVDVADACPNEKGDRSDDPKTSGCPRLVRVTGDQIVIMQEVNFATASDVISPDSHGLLEQVASVFAQHSEITRVAVEGHTDDVGLVDHNLALSQRRAVAVVRWLVDHGVDARRLEARGFGPRRPIASNDTATGKAKNRRVEFQILKRSPEGARAWREGRVE